jgi:hypothetical protein
MQLLICALARATTVRQGCRMLLKNLMHGPIWRRNRCGLDRLGECDTTGQFDILDAKMTLLALIRMKRERS